MPNDRVEEALGLMMSFAERTGLAPDGPQQRYLWTDAFAVCSFLALARATGEARFEELALRLVDRVHRTLGRHRPDDARSGWISGLDEAEGSVHPTRGGLRIGKKLSERGAAEPFDERLEWDRDGQYFHYLTRWMQALDRVAVATRQPRFNVWARELARTAHDAFTYRAPGGGGRRMFWKMSIDLKRPLVPSMGQHDPLDGLLTCAELEMTAARLASGPGGPSLGTEVASFASMIVGTDFLTADPLGLGGLLVDAYRAAQLEKGGVPSMSDLVDNLLEAAGEGLRHYAVQGEFREPASRRLAFRELGLTIGLQALELMRGAGSQTGPGASRARRQALLHAVLHYSGLGHSLESFWLDPQARESRTWSEHRDINEVMLATSLLPEGYLVLGYGN